MCTKLMIFYCGFTNIHEVPVFIDFVDRETQEMLNTSTQQIQMFSSIARSKQ